MITMETWKSYTTMVLVFLCLAVALVPGSHGLPIGVSLVDCQGSLTPDYLDPATGLHIQAQTGDSPYVLTVQPKTYTPGQNITVTVESWLDFEGILLQARAIGVTGTPMGTWLPKDEYTLLTCSTADDFLTHSDNTTKVPSVQFQWTAPSTPVGTVTFTAMIARNMETFWTPHIAVITNGASPGACSSNPCVNGLCFTGESKSSDLPKREPPNVITTDEALRDLLEKFNDHWEDNSYRDCVKVEERYSEEQVEYFGTLPAERGKLLGLSSEKTTDENNDQFH